MIDDLILIISKTLIYNNFTYSIYNQIVPIYN